MIRGTPMPPTEPKLTAREKRWQAEDDARTLATSEVVRNDPARLVRAKNAARRIAKQEKEAAQAMTHVATNVKGISSLESGAKPKPKKRKPPTKPTFNVFNKV
jgi:hypothetical protein